MNITNERLKQIIKEEVEEKLLNEIILQESFLLLLEAEELTDEEAQMVDDWKKNQTARARTVKFLKKAGKNFSALPKTGKMLALGVGLGLVSASGALTSAAIDFEPAYAGAASSFVDAGAQGAQSANTIKNFRDQALKNALGGQGTDDMEGFKEKHADSFESAAQDIVPGTGLPGENFYHVPADQISDSEILPLAGMSKADYKELIKMSFFSTGDTEKNLDKFNDFVDGGWQRGSSALWAYGPEGQLFSFFDASAPSGQRGLVLPPEWSVAHEVAQEMNSSNAIPENNDIDSIAGKLTWNEDIQEVKKMIKKELAKTS